MWLKIFPLLSAVVIGSGCNDNIPPSENKHFDVCIAGERKLVDAVRMIAGSFGLVEDERHASEPGEDLPAAMQFSSREHGKLVLSLFYFRGRMSYQVYEKHMGSREEYVRLIDSLSGTFQSLNELGPDGEPCVRAGGGSAAGAGPGGLNSQSDSGK